jgi:hypothetical protein
LAARVGTSMPSLRILLAYQPTDAFAALAAVDLRVDAFGDGVVGEGGRQDQVLGALADAGAAWLLRRAYR